VKWCRGFFPGSHFLSGRLCTLRHKKP